MNPVKAKRYVLIAPKGRGYFEVAEQEFTPSGRFILEALQRGHRGSYITPSYIPLSAYPRGENKLNKPLT
jgi:hypothetical protein